MVGSNEKPPEETDWTVLIQIDATPEKLSPEAKQERSESIKRIAESTKGKSIAVELQVVVDKNAGK